MTVISFKLSKVFIAAGMLLMMLSIAHAELDEQRIAATLAEEIEQAIRKYEGTREFRDRVVGRIAQCGLTYAVLAASGYRDSGKQFNIAGRISMNISARLSVNISSYRYKKILEESEYKLIEMKRRNDQKELLIFLRNCKSFNDQNEVDIAVFELTLDS